LPLRSRIEKRLRARATNRNPALATEGIDHSRGHSFYVASDCDSHAPVETQNSKHNASAKLSTGNAWLRITITRPRASLAWSNALGKALS
jgi:hypothetical protein